jgi:hypothetical protein
MSDQTKAKTPILIPLIAAAIIGVGILKLIPPSLYLNFTFKFISMSSQIWGIISGLLLIISGIGIFQANIWARTIFMCLIPTNFLLYLIILGLTWLNVVSVVIMTVFLVLLFSEHYTDYIFRKTGKIISMSSNKGGGLI